jgi:hypothetical protein
MRGQVDDEEVVEREWAHWAFLQREGLAERECEGQQINHRAGRERISSVILRRRSGDYNREGCSDILWRNNSGDVAAGR